MSSPTPNPQPLTPIIYRQLTTRDEFEAALDVEISVWGIDPRDGVPSYVMRAVHLAGGVTFGAFSGEQMVGMSFALPAKRENKFVLWSHVTGVLPAYQKQDIGFQLKQQQKAWAFANGYDEIRWTYDPLQRGNAHFNLHRLGATAYTYFENFYGAMGDAINAGMPSDRLEAVWSLHQGAPVSSPAPTSKGMLLLNQHGDPVVNRHTLSEAIVFAQVPHPLRNLPTYVQLTWRLALREALQAAFGAGFRAVDFTASLEQPCYVLQRP